MTAPMVPFGEILPGTPIQVFLNVEAATADTTIELDDEIVTRTFVCLTGWARDGRNPKKAPQPFIYIMLDEHARSLIGDLHEALETALVGDPDPEEDQKQ